jgi:hypothetical protein
MKKRLDMREDLTVIHTDECSRKIVNPWEIKSYYRSLRDHLCCLHRELVDVAPDGSSESFLLCKDCQSHENKNKIPENSIAAGVDLGHHRRIGLTDLNSQEQSVMAQNGSHLSVCKVASTDGSQMNVNHQAKIHAVLFGHDAPGIIAKNHFREPFDLLTVDNLCEDIIIQFMDPSKKGVDRLCEFVKGSSFVTARWWQLLSWLRVLKIVSPQYFFLAYLQTCLRVAFRHPMFKF